MRFRGFCWEFDKKLGYPLPMTFPVRAVKSIKKAKLKMKKAGHRIQTANVADLRGCVFKKIRVNPRESVVEIGKVMQANASDFGPPGGYPLFVPAPHLKSLSRNGFINS